MIGVTLLIVDVECRPDRPGAAVVLTKARAESRISESEIMLNPSKGLSFCATAILLINKHDKSTDRCIDNGETTGDIKRMAVILSVAGGCCLFCLTHVVLYQKKVVSFQYFDSALTLTLGYRFNSGEK